MSDWGGDSNAELVMWMCIAVGAAVLMALIVARLA